MRPSILLFLLICTNGFAANPIVLTRGGDIGVIIPIDSISTIVKHKNSIIVITPASKIRFIPSSFPHGKQFNPVDVTFTALKKAISGDQKFNAPVRDPLANPEFIRDSSQPLYEREDKLSDVYAYLRIFDCESIEIDNEPISR